GYLPLDPSVLAARRLAPVGTFVFDAFHDGAVDVLAATDAALDAIAALGGSLLVLIDRPSAARAATAGRSSVAERLGGAAWTRMVDRFRRAADRAAARGVRAVVHPHAGGHVEFADEVERLLDDAPELALCLDTGHALYAGDDPAELIHRW